MQLSRVLPTSLRSFLTLYYDRIKVKIYFFLVDFQVAGLVTWGEIE
jgi:hypothetical protein